MIATVAEQRVDDVDLVARYLDVRQSHAVAAQKVGKLADQLVGVYEPLRKLDTDVDQAHRTLAVVLLAEEVAGEKAEAVAMHRAAVIDRSEARETSKERGPRGRVAREKLARQAYDRAVHHDRVAEVTGRLRQIAEQLGTDDPARWQELRAVAEGTLVGAVERRREVLQQVTEAAIDVRQQIHGAQLYADRLAVERDEVAGQLRERGLDADRIAEAAARVLDERPGAPADPATEAALRAYQAREVHRVRSVELDEERRSRRAETRGGPALDR